MPDPSLKTLTFLFTDIEGSTVRWERFSDLMGEAVAAHDALLRTIINEHNGTTFKTVGDAFYAAFASANDAIAAAIAAQKALIATPWRDEIRPFRVRMALHTGEAELRDNDYFGRSLNRVARILSAGYGGQILLSRSTLGLIRDSIPSDTTFRDLGMHSLKDIQHPVQIFQLVHTELPADFPPLKTLAARRNNLPTQLPPCVGRETEVIALQKLLLDHHVRLVTLTGPGGVGKTRLALQLLTSLTEAFPDGIWFVELATVHEGGSIETAISQSIGHFDAGKQPTLEQVKARLEGRVLLFLDSFEQIYQANELVSELLDSNPQLTILITSRLSLNIKREVVYHISPLALPDPRLKLTPDELLNYGAIALFVHHAQIAKPTFTFTRANASLVAQICTRLDGLPLAIELAAARINMLSLPTMLKRLNNQLQLFTSRTEQHIAQHQTLRGTVEWSYAMLNRQERTLLHRLAIFRSGCTFEAIEAISSALDRTPVSLLEQLKSLSEKSLLQQLEGENGEPRFRVMYIIREYVLEQLADSDEMTTLNEEHAHYYLHLAEEIAPTLTGIEQKSSLAMLEEEHENLQAALDWYLQHGQIEAGLRMTEALWRFWWIHGHINEGRKRLEMLLASVQENNVSDALHIQALVMASRFASSQNEYKRAAQLAEQALSISLHSADQKSISAACIAQAEVTFHQGDYEQAAQLLGKSLTIQRSLGDRRATASILNNLGNVVVRQGNLDQAARFQEESLLLFRQVGDAWAISIVLTSLGEIERRQGNYQQAMLLYEESLHLCQTLGYTEGIATALASLGDLARYKGELSQAASSFKESLALFRHMDDKVGITACLHGLAEVAYAEKELEYATRLFAQADVIAYSLDTAILQNDRIEHSQTLDSLRALLDQSSFEGLWRIGQAMTLDQITAETPEKDLLEH